MWQGALPACCLGCDAFDRTAGRCSMLARPTLEHRRRVLSMPCNVERLLEERYRDEPALAERARGLWLSEERSVDQFQASFGRGPLDARLWLGSWPDRELSDEPPRPMPPREAGASELDENANRTVRTLDRISSIDPVDYALLVDWIRTGAVPDVWTSLLRTTSDRLTERQLLAVFRYGVVLLGALETLPQGPRTALATRRFAPPGTTDEDALRVSRLSLGRPELGLEAWQKLYLEGTRLALAALASSAGLGPVVTPLVGSFERALDLEAGSGAALEGASEGLASWLTTQRLGIPEAVGKQHLDLGTLARQVAGELPAGPARDTTAHLLVCEDDRCLRQLRLRTAGLHAVHAVLFGSKEPPAAVLPAPPSQGSPLRTALGVGPVGPDADLWPTEALAGNQLEPLPVPRQAGDPGPAGLGEFPRREARLEMAPTVLDRGYAMEGVGDPERTHVDSGAVARRNPESHRPAATKRVSQTIQVREALWAAFTHLAEETGRPIDKLVEEAMAEALERRTSSPRPSMPSSPPSKGPRPRIAPLRSPPPPPRSNPGPSDPSGLGDSLPNLASLAALAGASDRASAGVLPRPAPPPRSSGPSSPVPPTLPPIAPPPSSRGVGPSSTRMSTRPPPLPSSDAMPAAQVARTAPLLELYFNGVRYPVDQDRFVIGRAKASSDLVVDDPNVSRHHATIERQAGEYFIVDMGSTNGVEYRGERIARQKIRDGDTFSICSHEMTFRVVPR